MESCRLVIGLLGLLGSIEVEGSIIETIYHYSGDLRAGSNIPSPYASQFGIKANLKAQTENGSTVIFQFSDVSYQISTGPLADQEFSKAKFIPASATSDPLKQPFQVTYKSGKVKSILTMDEPEWSKNLKKSVAAIFQLDIQNLHFNESYSFFTKEETLHGNCTVGYTVQPQNDGYVDIIKTQEYKKCRDIPYRHFTNGVYETCAVDNNEGSLLDGSIKHYKLFVNKNKMEIRSIFSHSVTSMAPFNERSDDHTILVRQNLTSLSSDPIKEPLKFKPTNEIKNLRFVIPHYYNEMGTFSDLTGGSYYKSKEEIMEMAQKTLEELVDFMSTMKISKKPEEINIHLFQHILFYLGQLDQECLSHCFEKYVNAATIREKNLRKTFLQVAAQVGSKASIRFIRDTILNKKISEVLACEIMNLIPFYIRDPYLGLLNDYKTLLTADGSTEIKKTIILSISNFASKTYKKVHDVEVINYYADRFYKSFKDETDYESKLNYLSALTNLEEGKAFDYLMEITKNNSYSNTFRYIALWGTKAEAIHYDAKGYKLYWPIFSNRDEEIDMRIAAMKLIMTIELTFDRFLSLFWYMQAEKNSQLYYYFYTGLESYRNTNHPCSKTIGHYAKRLLRYAKKPVITRAFTGDYLIDHTNQKHSLGGYSKLSLIGHPKSGLPYIIHYSQGGYYGGNSLNNFGVLIKIKGIAEAGKPVGYYQEEREANVAALLKILSNVNIKQVSEENATIEIIHYANNHVIKTTYIDQLVFVPEPEIFGSNSWNFQDVIFSGVQEFVQPTDIGFPAIFNLVTPSSFSFVANISHNLTAMLELKNDIKFRYGLYWSQSLSFYNPLGGIWQGVQHTHSHMVNIPFYNHLTTDVHTHFQIKSIRNPENNFNLGFAYHTKTQVFATDYAKSNTLQESCPVCSPYETVVYLDNISKENRIFKYDSPETGLAFKLDALDCDQSYTYCDHIDCDQSFIYDLTNALYENFNNINLNYGHNPFRHLLLVAQKLHTFLGFQPTERGCGLIFEALPSKKYQFTQLEVKAKRIFKNYDRDFDIYGSIILQGEDDTNTYYNYTIKVILDQNSTNNHMKVDITHNTSNQQDFQISIDAENIYPEIPTEMLIIREEPENVKGKLSIMWGDYTDRQVPTNGGSFRLSTTASVLPAEEVINATVYPYSKCQQESKEKEWNGKSITPVTQACFMAAVEATKLHKFSGDMEYFNISQKYADYGAKFMKFLQSSGELHLIPYEKKKITAEINTSTLFEAHTLDGKYGRMIYLIELEKEKPVMNVFMTWDGYNHKQGYKINYDKLGFKPYLMSSRFSLLQQLRYNIGYSGSCVVTPSSVSTFDNDTFLYKASNCYTLASADCTDEPLYTLFTKKGEGFHDLAIKLHFGESYIEIKPKTDGDYDMNINGETITTESQGRFKYPGRGKPFNVFRNLKSGRFIKIKLPISNTEIDYNGHSMSINIHPFMRGFLCGMCGDFNGDKMYYERLGNDADNCQRTNYDAVDGEFLAYRYTYKTEDCPEINEEKISNVY